MDDARQFRILYSKPQPPPPCAPAPQHEGGGDTVSRFMATYAENFFARSRLQQLYQEIRDFRVGVLDQAPSKRVLSLTATTNGCASSCAALGRCFGSLISARRTKSFSSLLPSGTLGGGSCSTWLVQTHAHIHSHVGA
jgi:hypothetical protein